MGFASSRELPAELVIELALRYAIWIPVETYSRTPWLAPFAIRKSRLRSEPHAPGDARDLWGAPTTEGYFTDDNSLIKPIPLKRSMRVPSGVYGSSEVGRGLVCCHVWAGTTANPFLFSFIPNLVWLPADLATYTDAHSMATPHPLHDVLKVVSRHRFGSAVVSADRGRVNVAWSLLPPPTTSNHLSDSGNELADPLRISRLVVTRVLRLVTFLEGTLSPGEMPRRFSKRYHAGVGPRIDRSVWPIQQYVTGEAREDLALAMRLSVASMDPKSL